MARERSTLKLFLDSSVLFTAVNSPIGGSAKLFSLINLELVVSRVVLHEVEKNVRQKLRIVHLQRFFNLIKKLKVIDELAPTNKFALAQKVIAHKDAMILAQFKESTCDFLLTLDKRDFLQKEVEDFVRPRRILTPKDFFLFFSI